MKDASSNSPAAAPVSVAETPFPRFLGCTLKIFAALFLGFFALLVLDGAGSHVQVKGSQTKALAQAKQIGLALTLYADDHDGVYPTGTNIYGEPIRTSNDAFRCLFPTYTQSETIFGNKISAYQTSPPDNVIAPAGEILRPGENVYGYLMGAIYTREQRVPRMDEPAGAATPKSEFPGETPLIVDGTDGTGRGTYISDPTKRGGVWSGRRAVVIHLDNSGIIEILVGPENARYIEKTLPDGSKINALSPAALGPKLKLLDPAIAGK